MNAKNGTLSKLLAISAVLGACLIGPAVVQAEDPPAPTVTVLAHYDGEPVVPLKRPPSLHAVLTDFWGSAWNLDFTDGSGMMLMGSMGDYSVLVTDTNQPGLVMAQGSFVEVDRILIETMEMTQEELDAVGLISRHHYVVAGTLTGSTGFQAPIHGLATESLMAGEELVQGIVPLAIADNLPSAVHAAFQFSQFMDTPHLIQARNTIPGAAATPAATAAAVGERNCEIERLLCRDAALLRHDARRKEILADTLLIIVGCPAVSLGCGIRYFWCLWGCEAGALTNEVLRISASNDRLKADQLDCDARKLVCEAENKAN